MNSSAATALVIAVSLGLALVGYALRTLREEREASAADQPPSVAGAADESSGVRGEHEKTDSTSPPVASSLDAGDSADGAEGAPEGLRSVAHLLRDIDGRLVVEMEGRRYHGSGEVADALDRARLEAAVQDLRRMLRMRDKGSAAITPVENESATLDLSEARQPTPDESADVDRVSLAEAAAMPLQKPSMNVLDQWFYLRKKRRQPRVEIKSMLDEIGELVRARVTGTPWEARGLGISTDARSGAARFHLDGATYEDVDDLPDEAAREVVRASIAEWESR